MAEQLKNEKSARGYLRMLLCVFMAVVLATSMTPPRPASVCRQ